MAQSFNLKNIRTLLIQGFTDEELRRLCYDNPKFRPVYDRLSQGMGKARVIQELIEYAERQELVETLLAEAKKFNPARYKKHQPYYDITTGPTTSSGTHANPQKVASEADSTQSDGINGEAPKVETSEGDTAQEPQSSSSGAKKWWIPIPIAVAIIGLIGVIFTTVWNSGGDSDPTPVPTVGDFTYQVRVQDKDTNDNIPNAVVTIEVGGQAPLDGITDSTGLARIFVSSSHSGQPGRLIVEADGYIKYRQEIDITEGALPKDILLEPEP